MLQWTCEAVLFDLDGVLVDSTACVERHWRRWARKQELDPDEVAQMAHGRRIVEIVREAAPHLPTEEEAERLAANEAEDTEGVERVDGAGRLLQSLPEGVWAVVTSGTRAVATARIAHVGLPTPPVLVTADDVARGKPDPEAYQQAADRLGVPAGQCVVIEDAQVGVKAAQAAGMRVVAVSARSPDTFSGADAVVQRLQEITLPADGSSHRLAVRIEAQ